MTLENLKTVREENEKTQKEVANILEVSLGTYAMNEAGHDTITLTNLVKFCDYFHVSVDYVFGLTNQSYYDNTSSGFDKNTLKERIKLIRKENKYTQEKIGKLLNIDHSVWCRYEQGKTNIQTTFLYTICKHFHVSADYLLGKIEEPKYLKND